MATTLLLIIIYLSFISLGLPDSLLGSAWPSMYNVLNVPLHYAGFVSMIIAGGTVISSIFSERIIKRFGTGIVTAVSVLMTAAALIGFSFSYNFIYLCFCAIPLGLGAGSVDAALNNYVALHYKARHMSWLHCFWGVGASIGPIIMSLFLIRKDSWNLGYRTIGIIQFCLIVLLFISLPLWKKNKTTENSSQYNTVKFTKLLHIIGVKYVLIAFFCYCTIETITGLWGASFLVMVKNISPETAARWIALYYIGITFGRFVSGFVTIKLNNRQMIRLGQVLIGCGIIVLVLPFGNSTLLPGLFMIGLGCAPIFPGLLHETPENFGKENSQKIMGIQMASAYIGTTLMPPVFGRLVSYCRISA
jgi:fucose permease